MKSHTFLINVGLAVAVWLTTNLLAASTYLGLLYSGFDFAMVQCDWCAAEMYSILLLGWAISFPATLLLVILFYVLPFFKPGRLRGLVGVGFVLATAALVVVFFLQVFHAPRNDWNSILLFLTPYCISAPLTFVLLARARFKGQQKPFSLWIQFQNLLTKFNYGK